MEEEQTDARVIPIRETAPCFNLRPSIQTMVPDGAGPVHLVDLVYLVSLVCFVDLVGSVPLAGFVQPKNQTDQTNQMNQTNNLGWWTHAHPVSLVSG